MDGTRARALLGVPDHASADDVRRAFRRRALCTHPDRGGDAAGFDETVGAFEALIRVAPSAGALRAEAMAHHRPIDCYDTAVSRAPHTRAERPSFADVLQRVSMAAVPAAA